MSWEKWTKINGKCPKCGKESVERNDSIVLTSNPPQNQYRCTECNSIWSATNDNNAVNLPQADNSILNGPQVGDVPSYGFGWGQQGWVCPKCGRVYSPYTSMCPYCSGGNNNYEFTCETLPLKYQPRTICNDINCATSGNNSSLGLYS